MPHYYFHLAAPDSFNADEIGSEFPDIELAYLGACQAALEMSVEMLRRRDDPSRHRFEITNHDGALLFDLPFYEVLRPAAKVKRQDELVRRVAHFAEHVRQTRSELKNEFEQAASLIRSTRQLLAQVRI